MSEFIHLHNHSDFSLLDGAVSIESLVSRARELKMEALALTDHGNMFGAMKFYLECREQGVRPIIGSEFYLAPGSRLQAGGGEKSARYYHLVLLAENEEGYGNLLELSSRAYTEGFYYRPRIDDELLQDHHRGLIALSGCLGGEIPALILAGKSEEAKRKAHLYNELFGQDRFYLELQNHGIPEQETVCRELIRISRQTGIPLVATNDIHYLSREDALAQDILICIGTNKKVAEGRRIKFEHPEFYFKTPEEMARLFGEVPEALGNSLKIGDRCRLEILQPGPLLPHYEAPEGLELSSYLERIAWEGLTERYHPVTPQLEERLRYELKIIESMGYTGYFLVVWDFIRFARENKIPVGPGRGSGAGSLTAYALRITDIDPLKYGLLFERFLNPERVSMPDFDIDFCFEGREKVIEYVVEKYGADRVAQIITFGTLKARAVIRDVARVLDIPYAEADAIAKLVPEGLHMSLEKALELEPELKKVLQRGEPYSLLLDASRRLEGLNRHASTHAAGIVIGRDPLTRYVPLYRDPRTGSISTQYTMDYLEGCGLVKMDFLGLKTLTLIRDTLKMLADRGIVVELERIPENDPATFRLLGEGRSTGIFQFESQGMREILKRVKPESIRDLIALNALYRPGPMEFIDQFVDSKHGRQPIQYPLPELEPILKETYGVIVYQEQVMEIARQVADFSLGQADILRRAMGKKKAEVMQEQRELFVRGALAKGYPKAVAERIFDLLIPFAGYGFNKSHAAAYSVLAYQTAYLKANHPAEFMAATLTNEIASTDKLSEYIAEAREMGLEVLPPDINLSGKTFLATEGRIIYGLLGIKNVGSGAVDEILAARRRVGTFAGFLPFLEEVDLKTVNRKVLESLILCGVFDRLAEAANRATLLKNLDRALEAASRSQEARRFGQANLFSGTPEASGLQMPIEPAEEFPFLERLRQEKENLGFYFSGHPLDEYRPLIERHVTLDLGRLEQAPAGERVHTLIGVLKELKAINTKSGRRMAFGTLEDFQGSVELIFFSDVYEQSRELLKPDGVLAVQGKVDRNRGAPKLKVEKALMPSELKDRPPRAVHVRIRGQAVVEEGLRALRDIMVDKPGICAVYLHLKESGREGEVVVKASSQITLSAEEAVLQAVREHPEVEEVWKE